MNIIQLACNRLNTNTTGLAELLNIPYRTVYKWESGEREPPAAAIAAVKLVVFTQAHGLIDEWINERNEIMNESQLLNVAEAIMDSAASEYRATNLLNAEAVQAYAENGMDIYLSTEEAQTILDVCGPLAARESNGEIISDNDWHHEFTKPLSIG
ncbi:helix-turn-helix domain-containing protein [Erwinia sp. AnSW2-5]|uniref:helix-turn-helix domain-containing protein n=1 Tax=Erwinia sp. AnSW2-5 TaxID=3367692 RepID=UPI00385EE35C